MKATPLTVKGKEEAYTGSRSSKVSSNMRVDFWISLDKMVSGF